MGRWLFLPDTVQKDLENLSRCSAERIGNLRSLLDSASGGRNFANYLRVSEILGVSDDDAAGIYSFWDYVQRERADHEKSGADTIEELIAFLERKIASVKSAKDKEAIDKTLNQIREKSAALIALFEDCPKRDFARKSSLLESGPLPHLANLRSFCDLRPIYNKAGTEIVSQTALITLRLGTHSDHTDEHKELLINLREPDLDRLERELRRIRQKLVFLKKHFQVNSSKAKKLREG